jgi:peptide/nickel transport system ATP-binding protein
VKNVNLRVGKGEIVGVVGESGSGKSSLAGAVLGLRDLSSGSVEFYGKDIRQFSKSESKEYNRSVQAVFQDPYSSLNPRMTVLAILSEPWELHPDVVSKKERAQRAGELLEMVGLSRADLVKYPNEFSGGQRQRIAIARALALEPKIIVCDEAVSALDMTIQAQVIALLAELRTKLKLSYLFIAHDLTLVRKFADRVVVMKNGEVVEEGDSETVFANPSHPYTRKLVVSSPVPDPVLQKQRRAQLITA